MPLTPALRTVSFAFGDANETADQINAANLIGTLDSTDPINTCYEILMLASLASPNLTLAPNGGATVSEPGGIGQSSLNVNTQAITGFVTKQSDGNWLLSLSATGIAAGPANPTYYLSNAGNDGPQHTGSAGDPLATPQEAARRLDAMKWTGPATISVDNAIALGSDPFVNIPSPSGGGLPITIESTSYTDSGLGARTASGGAAPTFSAPPALGTLIDSAGGLTPNAWAGWYLRWTNPTSPNFGLRAAISSNTANTYALDTLFFSASTSGDTYVVEKPSGSFTFSGRFVLTGEMLRINGLDIVGTVDGMEGAIFDNQISLCQQYGVRFIPFAGGSGYGMTICLNCRYYQDGGAGNIFPLSNLFIALPQPPDGAPSQFLGTSTDPIRLYLSAGTARGSAGNSIFYGANFEYTHVVIGAGGTVTMTSPFPFNGGSMYSAGGAAIYEYYMVATSTVNNPFFPEGCFYADYDSYQSHFEASVNGVTGTTNLFGSGNGGIIDPFYVTGTNTTSGFVYGQWWGGQYFPASAFNSVADGSGFGQVKLIGSIPIVNVTDADQFGYLPAQLPANVIKASGKATTSGGAATATVVTATLPTETSGSQHNFYCDCVVEGFRTDAGNFGATFATKLRCCYKNPAGTPTQVGTDQALVADETFNDATEAGCTVASAVSAQNIQFNVSTPVGFLAGHNIRWTATVTVTMSSGF